MSAFKIDKTVSRKVRTLPELMALDKDDVKTITGWMDTRFVKNEKKLFTSEGSSGGRKWAALSPRYKKRKRKIRAKGGKKSLGKIMQLTGDLRKTLVNKGDDGHVAFGTVKPSVVISLGTRDRKAAWHGPTRFHNLRLPNRDVLQHTNEQLKGYLMLAADYFTSTKLPRVRRALTARTRLRSTGGRG